MHDCHTAAMCAAGTPLCATVQTGQNGHLDDGQEGMTRFVLCKKKKTVVVLLDNMKNSSSSTVITASRNCPRAPDDCSMKAELSLRSHGALACLTFAQCRSYFSDSFSDLGKDGFISERLWLKSHKKKCQITP